MKTSQQDTLAELGKIITPKHERDAVHLAVLPVQAQCVLYPGQAVSVDGQSFGKFVGIVDPFLKASVAKNDWFWLFLYPRTITSLKHVWSHPDVPDNVNNPRKGTKEASEQWIKNYCSDIGCRVGELMSHAEQWILYEDYWCDGGRWESKSLDPEFWTHYEKVTETTVDENKKESFFTCSC